MKEVFLHTIKKIMSAIILIGIVSTIFYHFVEGWSWLDSAYFTALIVTTVGHPNLVILSAASKIFTSILAFAGIALVLTLFGIVAYHYVNVSK